MGREEIVVQSIVFPDNTCQEMELYFRINERVYFENEHIYILPNGRLTTDTYMNLFDAAAWWKYTGIKKWKLCFQVIGSGIVRIKAGLASVAEMEIHCTEMIEKQMMFIKYTTSRGIRRTTTFYTIIYLGISKIIKSAILRKHLILFCTTHLSASGKNASFLFFS